MAQSGYTPILIYASGTTTNVPLAAKLISSASGAELALNYADGKLFYKDGSGVVQVLATKGAGTIGGSNTQIQYNNAGALGGSSAMTFDGTNVVFAPSGYTSVGGGGSEALRVTSNRNLLVGTNTDYTSTITAGATAINGVGLYGLNISNTASGGTGFSTNTNVNSSIALPISATLSGSASTYVAGVASVPTITNTGIGTSQTSAYGGYFSPSITSSTAGSYVSLIGLAVRAYRTTPNDLSNNSNSFQTGVNSNVGHGASLPSTALSGFSTAVSGTINNYSGTITAASAVRAQIVLGNLSGSQTSVTTTAKTFDALNFTVGQATGATASVTDAYGVYLGGPIIAATGTVTNYYALYAGTPTITGTLTNRYGVWIDDSSSTNYFAGNVGIGNSSPAYKLDVSGTVRITGALTLSATLPTSSGGTGLSSFTANGILYASSTSALATGTALTFDGTSLAFGSTSQRIIGDMSNGTLLNRLAFQTSTANGATRITAIPNGTGTITALNLHDNSDPTNSSVAQINMVGGTSMQIGSSKFGTGTYLPMTFLTNGTEVTRLTTTGNLLVGTTTDFTTTSTLGNVAIAGLGIYPYTTSSGTTNTTAYSSLNIETAFSGNGATANLYFGAVSTPKLTATATGGSNQTAVYGFLGSPSVQSSSTTARITSYGFLGQAVRNISTDTSTNASNSLVGGQFTANNSISAGAGIVTGTAWAVNGIVQNQNGTITTAAGFNSQIVFSSATTSLSSTTTTAAQFNGLAFTVGATSGGPGAVTNGYGVYLVGPTVAATGTMTNYYALYSGTPTVTGTLTNRYGVWIDDASATNYFGGNVGIGATANASAILDAQSTTKGVRMPNMTTTQKNAIASPAAGLMVFDTTLAKLCVYSGSAWQTITSV